MIQEAIIGVLPHKNAMMKKAMKKLEQHGSGRVAVPMASRALMELIAAIQNLRDTRTPPLLAMSSKRIEPMASHGTGYASQVPSARTPAPSNPFKAPQCKHVPEWQSDWVFYVSTRTDIQKKASGGTLVLTHRKKHS